LQASSEEAAARLSHPADETGKQAAEMRFMHLRFINGSSNEPLIHFIENPNAGNRFALDKTAIRWDSIAIAAG